MLATILPAVYLLVACFFLSIIGYFILFGCQFKALRIPTNIHYSDDGLIRINDTNFQLDKHSLVLLCGVRLYGNAISSDETLNLIVLQTHKNATHVRRLSRIIAQLKDM